MGAFGDAASEILMKLVLKGIEPTEAARLANQPLHALEAELNASLARQVEAHKKASDAMGTESSRAAKTEVKESLDKTKEITAAIQIMAREQQRAVAGMSTNWHRMMEDAENVSVVFETMKDVIGEGFAKLKELAEEIIKTSKVFASLKSDEGSGGDRGLVTRIFGGPTEIADARAAVEGTVSDMDLIMSKNKAAELDLKLTSSQFAKVAAVADDFASATGTNTAEALDKLISGLATGRTKLLAHAGVVIDTKKAYDDYAKSIDKTAESLNDEEKIIATQIEAFKKMDDKLAESSEKTETFGKALEQIFTEAKNVWDRTIAEIGSIDLEKTGLFRGLKQGLSDLRGNKNVHAAAEYDPEKALEDAQRSSADARMEEKYGGVATPETMSRDDFTKLLNEKPAGKPVQLTGLQRLFASAKDAHPFDQEAEDLATEAFDTMKKKLEEVFGEKSLFTPEEQAKILSKPWEALPDKSMGIDFLKAIGWDTETVADEDAKLDGEIEKRLKRLDDKIQSEIIKVQEDIQATLKQNKGDVGGFLSLFFGDDFLSQSREEMNQLERIAFDSAKEMNGILKDAGHEFAGAVGNTLAHSVGEFTDTAQAYEVYASSVGKKASELTDAERARVKAYADNQNSMANVLKKGTHDVLMNLSAQAFSKAALAAGEALFALASGNPASAAGFAASAAAFTAAGLAAGGLARATFTPGSESAPYLTGSRPTESRPGSGSGAGGGAGGGSGGTDSQPLSITIVNHIAPGGEAEAGRSMLKALEALKAETGIDIAKRLAA